MANSENTVAVNITLDSGSIQLLQSLSELGKQISTCMESAFAALNKLEAPLQKAAQAGDKLTLALKNAVEQTKELGKGGEGFGNINDDLAQIRDSLKKLEGSLTGVKNQLINFGLNVLSGVLSTLLADLIKANRHLNLAYNAIKKAVGSRLKKVFPSLDKAVPTSNKKQPKLRYPGRTKRHKSQLDSDTQLPESKTGNGTKRSKLNLGKRGKAIGIGIAAIAAFAGTLTLFTKKAEGASTSVNKLGNSIEAGSGDTSSFLNSMEPLLSTLPELGFLFLSIPGSMGKLGGAFKKVNSLLVKTPAIISGAFKAVGPSLLSISSTVGGISKSIGASLLNIPSMAGGAFKALGASILQIPSAVGIMGGSIKNAFLSIPGAIGKVGGVIKGVGALVAANPIMALLTGIALVATLIISNWESISSFFSGIFGGIQEAFASFINWILDKIPNWLKKVLGIEGGGVELEAYDESIKEGAANFNNDSGASIAAGAAVSTATMGGAHSETVMNVGGITVNAKSSDAAGIARETGNELRRMTSSVNSGVQ